MIPVKMWKKYLKYTPEERKSCKKYYKMIKNYKKQLKKEAKEFVPWEPETMISVLSVMLHYTRDYFAQDYNVWQDKSAAENNFEKTIASLNECCRCIDELQNISPDDMIGHYVEARLGTEFTTTTSDGHTMFDPSQDMTKEETKELKAIYKQVEKDRDRLKLDLFMTIAKNYERWWD